MNFWPSFMRFSTSIVHGEGIALPLWSFKESPGAMEFACILVYQDKVTWAIILLATATKRRLPFSLYVFRLSYEIPDIEQVAPKCSSIARLSALMDSQDLIPMLWRASIHGVTAALHLRLSAIALFATSTDSKLEAFCVDWMNAN